MECDAPDPSISNAPYRLYNIGHNDPVNLLNMINMLEDVLGKKAQIVMKPMQPGDVLETYADIDAIDAAVGFKPSTSLEEGLAKFAEWYRGFYGE